MPPIVKFWELPVGQMFASSNTFFYKQTHKLEAENAKSLNKQQQNKKTRYAFILRSQQQEAISLFFRCK